MDSRTDQQYLLCHQYRNADNLSARMNLHARYKTNPHDWFEWVFDHFNLPEQASLLELGCGPGNLWIKNLERIPQYWNITLSDFSPGMLSESQKNLSQASRHFNYRVIDAQQIPIADMQLDAVIANHMLYHVPDRPKAFSEIHRVLKPEGILYCATNGENHLKELDALYEQLQPFLDIYIDKTFSASAFTLENGTEQLSHWFNIRIDYYPDALVVTEADPLIAYLLSMIPEDRFTITTDQILLVKKYIEEIIQQHGSFRITKSTGIFIAQKKSIPHE